MSRWRLRRRRCAWAPALSPRKPSPSPPPPPHRNSAAPTSTLAVLPPPHLARARCHETPRRVTWLLPRGCRSGRALCRPRIKAVPRCSESCTRSPTMPARTASDLPARAVVRAWIPAVLLQSGGVHESALASVLPRAPFWGGPAVAAAPASPPRSPSRSPEGWQDLGRHGSTSSRKVPGGATMASGRRPSRKEWADLT